MEYTTIHSNGLGPVSIDKVNLNKNLLIHTPEERPPLLKCHFSGAKKVALQEWFHCIVIKIVL